MRTGSRSDRFEVREARPADLRGGLLETLGHLSDLGGLDQEEGRAVLREMKRAGVYHLFVACTDEGRVVGATTLVVERKLIHRGGKVGHVEDVAVRAGFEGSGVGSSLVRAALAEARSQGCYKCILDCKEELAGFYERLGFKRHDVGMRADLGKTVRKR